MISCASAVVVLVIAWFLVPSFYHVTQTGITVSSGLGSSISVADLAVSRGLSAGFVLTALETVIGLAGSILALGRVQPKRRGLTHIPPPTA